MYFPGINIKRENKIKETIKIKTISLLPKDSRLKL